MADRIFVDNLRVNCRIGATEEEKRQPQDVLVDVKVFLELGTAGRTDRLEDTVNYRELIRLVSDFAAGGRFTLLESLVDGIASVALAFPRVERVWVRARKAKYLSEPSVGVEIERERRDAEARWSRQ